MWSSRRALLAGLLALPACGFTPVYGPGGTADGLRGTVRVAAPDDRDSFAFVEQMEIRLGRPASPRFDLSYSIEIEEEGLAITGSNAITRFNVTGLLSYAVRPVGSEAVLAQGTLESFTGYSASGSTISTLTAERDARARLMVILADKLVTRLLVDPGLA